MHRLFLGFATLAFGFFLTAGTAQAQRAIAHPVAAKPAANHHHAPVQAPK